MTFPTCKDLEWICMIQKELSPIVFSFYREQHKNKTVKKNALGAYCMPGSVLYTI